jgi:hypothetical protein
MPAAGMLLSLIGRRVSANRTTPRAIPCGRPLP